MRYALFIFLVIFYSCSQSVIGKEVKDSDSLIINFNNPQDNTIIKTVSTTEGNAISRLAGFVKGGKTGLYKCGYDGNMIFFAKGEKKADISFQYKIDSCRHFIFDSNGELTAVKMNKEAADFLESLASGRTSY